MGLPSRLFVDPPSPHSSAGDITVSLGLMCTTMQRKKLCHPKKIGFLCQSPGGSYTGCWKRCVAAWVDYRRISTRLTRNNSPSKDKRYPLDYQAFEKITISYFQPGLQTIPVAIYECEGQVMPRKLPDSGGKPSVSPPRFLLSSLLWHVRLIIEIRILWTNRILSDAERSTLRGLYSMQPHWFGLHAVSPSGHIWADIVSGGSWDSSLRAHGGSNHMLLCFCTWERSWAARGFYGRSLMVQIGGSMAAIPQRRRWWSLCPPR